MTNILAIDASTEICSVALQHNDTLSERVSEQPRAHADRLLPMVDELLSEAGLDLNQLDAVGFGAGPGSFTGLRICLSVVQGLAFAADLPVVPVSTLEAMALGANQRQSSSVLEARSANAAESAKNSAESVLIAPVLDARMNEVYLAVYRLSGAAIDCMLEPRVLPVQAAETLMHDFLSGEEVVGVGSGWRLLPQSRTMLAQCDDQLLPSAAAVCMRASQTFKQGQYTDAAAAEPVYLRNEISWKKRERIRIDVAD